MASSRPVDDAHPVRDDARVDRDLACVHSVVGLLALDVRCRKHAGAPFGQAGCTAGEHEKRKRSKEVAHGKLEARQWTRGVLWE
jgi:hypothetical protein